MQNENEIDQTDWRCEEKCTLAWVECMDAEDRASICKTRERNCFEDCSAEWDKKMEET